ncbi:MAG: MBL fold metallo-hydrolase, partial [Mogibacterium sp.]|nr:MBL fold metallo-hydrolase [Mogibacterium sp.]
MSLKIDCFPYGPLTENTYIVTDETTGDKAVIDPGCFGNEIAELIAEPSSLKYILLTHGHYDHFAAAQQYIDAYPDVIFAGPAGDAPLMYKGRDNVLFSSMDRGTAVCPEAKLLLKEGDVIKIGESELRVIETPGHTMGSICFVNDEVMFSGDL